MKKSYVLLSILLLALLQLSVASAEYTDVFTVGDFEYRLLTNGTAEITGYTGNATELTVPEEVNNTKVTSIGDDAFFACSSLISINIPEGLTTIGYWAFAFCESLTSVSLPNSLASIGDHVFAYCYALKEIRVSPFHPTLSVVDGVLFSKKDHSLLHYPQTLTASSYTVPHGTKHIAGSAFDGCTVLTSITLPEGLTSIDNMAFSRCESLTSINLPEGLYSIGYQAFYSCNSLTSITLPESLEFIDYQAFYSCNSLDCISLPNSLLSIDDTIFDSCPALTTIYVTPGSYAESWCKKNGRLCTYKPFNE